MKLLLENLLLVQGSFRLQIDLETTGEVIGVFGASGAGKTSLLEIVAGLRQPETGTIRIDETLLSNGKIFVAPERRGIGYVPQDLALFPHFSVRKNLNYGRRLARRISSISFDHVVAVLEIEPLLERSVAQLSGGQKQRVAFARALLAHPRLLLMDEPLASLDHELKLRIIPYLQRIRDDFKIPMLYVSHSPDEILALCDQVLLLQAGKCLGLRRPSEIFEATTSMALKPGLFSA